MNRLNRFIKDLRDNSVLIGVPSKFEHYRNKPAYVVARHKKYTILQFNRSEGEPVFRLEDDLTVSTSLPKNAPSYSTQFVAYPTNAEHAHFFAKSETTMMGPNSFFPGSIGLSELYHFVDTKEIEIKYVQFSFKQGSPKQITRNLASKYQGARNRILRETLNYIQQFENHRVTLGRDFSRSSQNNSIYEKLLHTDEFAPLLEHRLG